MSFFWVGHFEFFFRKKKKKFCFIPMKIIIIISNIALYSVHTYLNVVIDIETLNSNTYFFCSQHLDFECLLKLSWRDEMCIGISQWGQKLHEFSFEPSFPSSISWDVFEFIWSSHIKSLYCKYILTCQIIAVKFRFFYVISSVKIRLEIMAFPVVEFSREGYKIRKVFG